MTALAYILDALVWLRHRFGRCPHVLQQMPGGARCILCPRVWAWGCRALDNDD